VGWQDRRTELHPLVLVGRIVPHAWRTHLQGSGAGHDAACRLVAVAHDQALALFVTPVLMLLEKDLHFGFDGLLEHLLSALANDLVQQGASLELLPEIGNLHIEGVPLWILKVKCRSLLHGVSFQPSLGPLMKLLATSRIRHLFPLT